MSLTTSHELLPSSQMQKTNEGVIQFDSSQLLRSAGYALIEHKGQVYQLRETKAGKLILTK